MMIGTILMLIVQLLPGILSATGVVTPAIAALISQLGGSLPALITSLTAGKGPTADFMAVLAALKPEIAALKTNTALSPEDLALADSLDDAMTKALAGYADAEDKTDPNSLTDLPETLPNG
jgi:hypothetical protein